MEVKVIDGWLLEDVKSLEPDFRVKYILASFLVLNAFTHPHLPDGSEPSQGRLGWPFETWQFFHGSNDRIHEQGLGKGPMPVA